MMHDLGILGGTRLFMVLVSAAVLVVMVVRFTKLHEFFSRTLKLLMVAMFLFVSTVVWDTLVLLHLHASFSWRMLPFALGIALCIAALAEPPDTLRKRYQGNATLNRDTQLKAQELEIAELRDRLYESLRRDNSVSTRLLLAEAEIGRLRERHLIESKENRHDDA